MCVTSSHLKYVDVKNGVYSDIVELVCTEIVDDYGVVIFDGDILTREYSLADDGDTEWIVSYCSLDARFKMCIENCGDSFFINLSEHANRKDSDIYKIRVSGNIHIQKRDKKRKITGIG